MRGSQVMKEINQRSADQAFIRWWRKENDFADFELVDEFCKRENASREFGGFELLDHEQMWQELLRICPDRLSRKKQTKSGEVIIWKHRDAAGKMFEETCPFSASTLMEIFDAETRGDTLV